VNENWAEAARLIEEAVQQYYVQYEQCLDGCDALFDTGSFTETYRKVIGTSSLLTRVRLVTGTWVHSYYSLDLCQVTKIPQKHGSIITTINNWPSTDVLTVD
jgi:hypothetical protein